MTMRIAANLTGAGRSCFGGAQRLHVGECAGAGMLAPVKRRNGPTGFPAGEVK